MKLGPEIMGNAAVTVAFFQKEPDEAQYMARLLAGTSADEWKQSLLHEELNGLQQFEALAVTTQQKNPVKVRIEPPKRRNDEKAVRIAPGLQPVVGARQLKLSEASDSLLLENASFSDKLERIFKSNNLEFKKAARYQDPDYEIITKSGRIAVLVDSGVKRIDRITAKAVSKRREYGKVILVTTRKRRAKLRQALPEVSAVVETEAELLQYLKTRA